MTAVDRAHRGPPSGAPCADPGGQQRGSTAAAASTALFSSRPVTASRRSTGTPPAMLAAIQQHPPLTARARQRPRQQRAGRRLEVDRRHFTAPLVIPWPEFHGYFQEILAVKPRAVPDQQLNRCLRAEKAFRPRPQRCREVIKARSKAGESFDRIEPRATSSPSSRRVRLFKRQVIWGCFGHAARLKRSMVSSS